MTKTIRPSTGGARARGVRALATILSSIREHVEGPIAFTEVGWYAANLYEEQGWGSSPQEQAQFAQRFLAEAGALAAETSI